MKQKFIDCMMKFSHDAWGGDSIPSTEKSFAEVFDVLVKAGFIQEWQPIETAPKDGTNIIAGYWKNGMFKRDLTFWEDGHWWQMTQNIPTYWQPLSLPPSKP